MRESKINQLSKEEFALIVAKSKCWAEVVRAIGYSITSSKVYDIVKLRVLRDDLDVTHFIQQKRRELSFDDVFCINSTVNQSTLRRWYIKEELAPYVCAICGQEPFWNHQELSLTLDHINGINGDNQPKNLRWVCPNCDRQLDTFGGKNKKHEKKECRCIDCDIIISSGAIRCISCAEKNNRKVEWPSREKLKELIRSQSFTAIGKSYGVSYNAVKKWCINYGLPSLKREIKQYTDEQWTNV